MKKLLWVATILSAPSFAAQEWIVNIYDKSSSKPDSKLAKTYKLQLKISEDSFGNPKLDNIPEPNGGKETELDDVLNRACFIHDFKGRTQYFFNELAKACPTPDKLKIETDFYPIPSLRSYPNIKTDEQTRSIKKFTISGCFEPMPSSCSYDKTGGAKGFLRGVAFLNPIEACTEALKDAKLGKNRSSTPQKGDHR